jgi:RNA polymerase sigma factor (sigma-70 family)
MQGQTVGARPSRAQIDMAALELVRRYGASLLSMARRHSVCAEDAEDAYQRGLEILLTKAPSARHEELVPWLRTVVKHEAFEIRRQRLRAVPTDKEVGLIDETAQGPPAEIHAQRLEKLRLGAEAMSRLKPPEIRCLLLKAEGYSYDEISAQTGFSFTKVNRSLSEGRRSFRRGLASIESGAECRRLAPLLSRLADGEASGHELSELRLHLRGCAGCRATLRDYRAVPARVSALVPPVAVEPVSRVGELIAAAKAYLAGMFGSAVHGGAGATVGKAAAIVAIGGAAIGGAAIQHREPVTQPKGSPEITRTDDHAVAVQRATVRTPLRPPVVSPAPQRQPLPTQRRSEARATAPQEAARTAGNAETFGFEQSRPETTNDSGAHARPPAAAPAAEPEAEFSFER